MILLSRHFPQRGPWERSGFRCFTRMENRFRGHGHVQRESVPDFQSRKFVTMSNGQVQTEMR